MSTRPDADRLHTKSTAIVSLLSCWPPIIALPFRSHFTFYSYNGPQDGLTIIRDHNWNYLLRTIVHST